MRGSFTFWGKNRIYFATQAVLIETEREIASDWASSHIVLNPAHAWILGKFVEAEQANKNQQYFSLDGLQMGNPSIAHGPMNINHNPRNVVGAFVASELIFPANELAGDTVANPFIESLAVFWKYYFQDEYRAVQQAAGNGGLFYSMECVPTALSTIGGTDDSVIYPYEGRQSPNYSTEINERKVPMLLHDPHFTGGALVIPPESPAWRNADAKMVSSFMNDNWNELEMAYEGVKEDVPDLDASMWEALMCEVIGQHAEEEMSRQFSQPQREKLAKSGAAMPGGEFPIVNEQDLHNAIRAIGRAKDPAAAKAHIKMRAKALGLSKIIPPSWG